MLEIINGLEGTPQIDEELALYNKAGDLYLKLGDVNAAVEMYERAAHRYSESGFANNAIALCNKILRNAPGRTHVYLMLAQLLAHRGFVAQAKQNFVEYAERMSRAGKMNEAFTALKKFADMSPDNEEIRLMLAEQLKAAARDDEAKEQLAKLYSRTARGEDEEGKQARASKGAGAKQKGKTTELVFIDLDDKPVAPSEAPAAQAVEEPPVAQPPVEQPIAPEAESEPEVQALEIQTTGIGDDTVTEEVEEEEEADFKLEIEHTAQGNDEDVPMIEGLATDASTLDIETEDQPTDVDLGGLTLEPTATFDADEPASDVELAPSDGISDFELPEEPVSADDVPGLEVPEKPVSADDVPGWEAPEEPVSEEPVSVDDLPGLEIPEEPVSAEDISWEIPEEPISSDDLPGLEIPEEAKASDDVPSIELPEEPVLSDEIDIEISDEPITIEVPEDELPVLEVSTDSLEIEVDYEATAPSAELTDLEVPDLDLHGFDDVAPDADVEFITQDETSDSEEETPGPEIDLGESEPLRIITAEPEIGPGVEELEELVLEEPNDPARRRTYAEALVESGERERGLEELDMALSGFEDLDDWAHAHAVATEILRLDPNSVNHHQKRVEYAVRMGERSQMVEAYLELAHALFRSGGLDRARIVYERVLEHDPQNLSAREALATITPEQTLSDIYDSELEADAVATTSEELPPDDFVDLGEFILGDEADQKDTRMRVRKEVRTGDEKRDFDEMLMQFKRGIEANIDEEDAQAHYDLGVAFKEMGLLDEAISEFQKALRSPEARLQAAEALGTCFFDKDQYEVAATVLRRAIDTDPGEDEEKIGLLYRLGRCEEAQSRPAEALNWYQRVFAVDINFRDVTDRVNSLAKAGR